MSVQPATAPARSPFIPHPLLRFEDCGLSLANLADLMLKHLYLKSPVAGRDWAAGIGLPYQVIEPAARSLIEQGWCQTIGLITATASSEQFGHSLGYQISDQGRVRARDLLSRDQYAGIAPVPYPYYEASVHAQVLDPDLTLAHLAPALAHLTLSPQLPLLLGPAISARAPLFLHGPPGNGKTSIAEACANLLGPPIYVPFAVAVEGQVMRIFDPLHHRRLEGFSAGTDGRWAVIARPFVKTGGELTMDSLEPAFDQIMRYYEAPIQLKANGGILLLDDFGRQEVAPRILLNRLIVSLERRVDYLRLTNVGKTLVVPFQAMVVFSTNLEPASLVDEAFLRRVRYKIHVPDPTAEEFRRIFEQVCRDFSVPFDDSGYRYLVEHHYKPSSRPFRGCHPRDLIQQIRAAARFLSRPATLEPAMIDLACRSYFVN